MDAVTGAVQGRKRGNMSDRERHKGCGGLVYSHHQGEEWYVFCQKCGLRTNTYNTWRKAEKAWNEMIRLQEKSKE